MPRGKKKNQRAGGRNNSEDDDSDDGGGHKKPVVKAIAESSAVAPMSRKAKKQQKQQQKKVVKDSDDDDDFNDNIAALLGGGGKQSQLKSAYGPDDDDSSDNDNDGDPPPLATKPAGKKGQKKDASAASAAAAFGSSSSDEEEEDDNYEANANDIDSNDGEQVAVKLLDDDDWGMDSTSKKKKKDKKEKKEKKQKKEKKKKKHKHRDDVDEGEKIKSKKTKNKDVTHDDGNGSSSSEEDSVTHVDAADELVQGVGALDVNEAVVPMALPTTATVPPAVSSAAVAAVTSIAPTATSNLPTAIESRKKTKFELQMEAAMRKKEIEALKSGIDVAAAESTKTMTKMPPAEAEPDADFLVETRKNIAEREIEERKQQMAGLVDVHDGNDEIMYGAPDDVVWSDKSQAMRDAEAAAANAGAGNDVTHSPDGKKLSNKDRKKQLKALEAAERAMAYEAAASKASREGAQFACSQTAVNEKDPQWENALDITIPNFSISAAGKVLFKDAAFNISHGRRYGLVGPNGRGKSTLLKMIASGDLKLPPRIDFLYVEQEVVADNTPAVEAVLRADVRRWKLLEEEQTLMDAVDNGDESEANIDRLQVVVDELTAMGADAAEAKARRILAGLGFGPEMQTKPTKMFSGGWRMRISLAQALYIEPTLLMLDEPTNHLDLNAVIWLDSYLQTWKKTLLVVSHDQDFLNSVCQEILHIEDLRLISYKGNYDSFKKAEATRFQQQVKAWEKQEKRLRELKKSGQSKAKAQEQVKKTQTQRESGARSQKKKNEAIAAGTETAEQAELIKRPKEYTVKLEFPQVQELSRPVLEVNNVHFRYSPKHPVLFDCVDFGIDMDSRITIVGPNGAGKTTLLKLLTGEIDPTTGEVRRNPRLRLGIYNQHFVDRLPMNKTPVEYLRDRYQDETYQTVRNRLGKYGLEGHAHEVTMRDLSGGQKARVVLVDLSLQRCHVLCMDEPTNHLDIETIDALTDAINEFNGGVVVVTHDQRLIEECECTLWVVEKRGVTKWEAGFDDYKATILREVEEQVAKDAEVRRAKVEAAAAAKREKLAKLASKAKGGKK